MKIAICDDEKELLDKLKTIIETEFKRLETEVKVDCYETGEAFLEGYANNEYAVAFLDVYLPGISGFEVADKMHQINSDTYKIFITSNSELVYDCFDYQPFYFIRKTSYTTGVPRAISKLLKVMKQNKVLMISDKYKQYKIMYKDIIYMESEDHSILVHTVKYDYTLKDKKISDMELEMQNYDFIRVHRKYIINLKYLYLVDMSRNEVELNNKLRLEMSRYYKIEVKDAHNNYSRSMK